MKKIEYKNRYNDVFTFSKTLDGNILMEGNFEFMRFGHPNVYDEAYYDEYIPNTHFTEIIALEKFIEEIHGEAYNKHKEVMERTDIAKKYSKFVYSDETIIDMIDSSGGPYLIKGTDMGKFDKSFEGMIIDQFKQVDNDYLIIIQKN